MLKMHWNQHRRTLEGSTFALMRDRWSDCWHKRISQPLNDADDERDPPKTIIGSLQDFHELLTDTHLLLQRGVPSQETAV